MKSVVFATVAALPMIAQAGPVPAFGGPFVELAGGYARSETSFANNGFGVDRHQSNPVGRIFAGYNQPFHYGDFNVAAGMYYIVGHQKAGKLSESDDFDSGEVTAKATGTWGVLIAPGISFDDDWYGYLIAGYSQTRGRLSANIQYYDGTSASASREVVFHGYTYGIGAKYKFTEHWYGTAEAMQTSYYRKDGFKPKLLLGTVGIGYQF